MFFNKSSDNLPYEKIGKEVRCIADEIPFEIPENWGWTRLGTLVQKLTDGTHFTPKYTASGIPFLSVKDISSGKISFDNVKYISQEEHNDLFQRCDPQKGDILLTKVGTTGIPVLIETDREFSLFVSVALLKYSKIYLYGYFLVYLLQSPLVQNQCAENTKGVGNKNWVMKDISQTLLAIPPLAEQKRIVAKIEELLPHIEEYGKAESKVSKLNVEFLEQLKKSILQWAIQGKLVPQNPDDEPASVLLECIRAEKAKLVKEGKIKKDKNESVIFRRDNSHYEKLNGVERCIDDEIPFEIPDSWEWVRLGEVFQHNTGKALNSSNRDGKRLKYITTSNLYWDRFEISTMKEMLFTDAELDKCTVRQGDLLVCEGGDIGRAAIWSYDTPICIQNHIHRLRSYSVVCTRFFYYLFFLYKSSGLIGGKGIGIQGLSSNAIHSILFPVPPLAEQQRIVDAIEKAFKKLTI